MCIFAALLIEVYHCSWENVSTAEKMLAYSQRSTKNVKSNTKTDYEKWEISCFRIYVSL